MNPAILFPEGAKSGAMRSDQASELRKALEAGYGSDVSQLTGGAALRVQSLERAMLSTIQENEHFKLFNALAKSDATATVDEWTEQDGVGGHLGGSTNTETGSINPATGSYNRRVGLVKYLMTLRQVSFVQSLQSAIAESEAVEAQNGALQLLTDAEFLCFEGDSAVVPTEFDGIGAQIASLNSADHLLDAEGQSLNSINLLADAAATIASYGNFGKPTDIFWSQKVQADMDIGLDPAFRVPLTDVPGGGVNLGSPVIGLRTSQGNIKTQADVFVRDEAQQTPFEVAENGRFAGIAAANNFKPAAVAPVAAAGGADSKWGAAHAGNYYYAVAGINAKGQSNALISAQVAVAAGEAVTLTISPSASGEETGYVIYRGRKNGTNALSDLR
ncbi:MAG TPA: hypothetical protein VFL54_01640, partial [Gammaproteobacteria bacterium]|nr:hypothetical protein [Gammaproteobacteria bacterium]